MAQISIPKASKKELSEFLKEAEILSKLIHPVIVPMHNFVRTENEIFYTQSPAF